jgi:O-antigen/teichoic acid export membrane protein
LWVVGGRLAAGLIGLASIRVATMLLPPAEYGALALLLVFQAFCGLVLVSPLGQHLNRHTHEWWDDGTLRAKLRTFGVWIAAIATVGGAITFVWLFFGERYAPGPAGLAALAVLGSVFLGTLSSTFVPLLNMVGFRQHSVLWSVVAAAAGLVAAALLSVAWPGALAWLFGQMIGLAVGALGAWRILWSRARVGRHVDGSGPFITREAFYAFCVPLAIATVFMWLQTSGYRVLVEQFWGLAALGHVAVGLALAAQLWSFAESLAINFLYPYFYRRISAHESEGTGAFSDLLNVLGPIYLLLTGAILLAADSLLRLFVDPQYAAAGMFVALGAVIDFSRAATNLFGNAAQVTRRTKAVILPWFTGAVAASVLALMAGLQGLDIEWAIYAVLAGGAASLATMVWRTRRILPFHLDAKRWGLAAAALCVCAVYMSRFSGALEAPAASIGRLLLVAVCFAAAVAALLWRNAALTRLVAVKLQ